MNALLINKRARRACLVCLAWAIVSHSAWALDACSLLTERDAAALLGGPPGDRSGHETGSENSECTIKSKNSHDDRLKLTLTTVSPEAAPRVLKHLEEARGDEVPTLHGAPWYQVALADPEHKADHRFVIYRDRTSLTVDLHSTGQADAKQAFELVWLEVALRLPTDEH